MQAEAESISASGVRGKQPEEVPGALSGLSEPVKGRLYKYPPH